MSDFNLGQFFNKMIDYSLSNLKRNTFDSPNVKSANPQLPDSNFSQNLPPRLQSESSILNTLNSQSRSLRNLQMNHIANIDRALYVKDLMNLPKNLEDLLQFVQSNAQKIAAAKDLPFSKYSIDLSQIGLLFQQNGKEALNKTIMAMSNASKQGIEDLSEIKETMKLINASVSAAGEKNTSQTLKTLILLYLPWLPLQEGVDFELEVEAREKSSGEDESALTIMISTKNYGNIKATLVLTDNARVTAFINCSDKFPKEELLKRLKSESEKHSIQTEVSVEQKPIKQEDNGKVQARINSSSSQISPSMLLMAHAIIKNTLEIDKEQG